MTRTVKIQKPSGPARSPAEIAKRLVTLAKQIDRKLEKGETLDEAELRSLAKRLRSYAVRLHKAPTSFSIY